MANTYLSRTPASAGNRKTMTFSFWLKRGTLETTNATRLFNTFYNAGANQFWIRFADSGEGINKISIVSYDSGFNLYLITNAVYRDVSAWYHIVIAIDTTQATSSDRAKLWINGEQVTSFSTATYPSQNYDTNWNVNQANQIGANGVSSNEYFTGSMSHVHFIDGTAYDASTFGETDATTGIWKPKTAPSVTYGTNGFFLKFENSGSMGTDSSGNANNFTVNGNLTQTVDTPSNVFATLNPLDNSNGTTAVVSNGNLTLAHTGGANPAHTMLRSTLAVSKGKYYCEYKQTVDGGTNRFGIVDIEQSDYPTSTNPRVSLFSDGYAYRSDGDKENNNINSSYGNSYSAGDIIGVAFDADNGVIWFSKNGTWQNSATIAEIEAGTTTNAAFTGIDTSKSYGFASSPYNNQVGTHNFGNGYFGTTPVASAQNPDDGIGIFEYAVPTGYKALCTKSINAQEYS